MAKLIFKYTDEDFISEVREAKSVELDVPGDMDIHEYKIMCIRMASSLGYTESTITKSFGDLVYGQDNKNNLKDLLDELKIRGVNKKTRG